MKPSILGRGSRARRSVLTALLFSCALVALASHTPAQTIFSENFDGPPPYRAILDPTDPGGWEVSTDPFPGWPPHNGFGKYARAHDLCNVSVDRLLRFPEAGALIDLGGCSSATLKLWAAHGTCTTGCPGTDSCRLAIRKFTGGGFTESTLYVFPNPTLANCGGPGAWTANLSLNLSAFTGSTIQIVVHHATSTIDHLLIDDVRVEGSCNTLPGMPQCFGDGSGASCPCGNTGGPGQGCRNGLGVGAILTASGQAGVTNDTFALTAGLVPAQPGLFFQGNSLINGGIGAPFGDGLRCCGVSIVRLEVAFPPPPQPSVAEMSVNATCMGTAGTIFPGATKCYQYWYRNPGTSPCGSGFNLSNGWTVTWTVGDGSVGCPNCSSSVTIECDDECGSGTPLPGTLAKVNWSCTPNSDCRGIREIKVTGTAPNGQPTGAQLTRTCDNSESTGTFVTGVCFKKGTDITARLWCCRTGDPTTTTTTCQ